MQQPLPPFPNFIILGFQRCATRWLRVNLDLHPDIYTLPNEAGFFNDEERRTKLGPKGYRKLFEGWKDEPFIGELTSTYLSLDTGIEETSSRMAGMLPDARLLALVRNPIDRVYSAIFDAIRRGWLPAGTDIHALDPDDVIRLGLFMNSSYASPLFYFDHHYRDQLKVLVYDDIEADPAAVYRSALEHIGADPTFVPPNIAQPLFSSSRTAANYPAPTHEQRMALWGFFEDTVRHLENYLERDLSAWNPEA